MASGWKNESERHKLSRNGIRTKKGVPRGIQYKEELRFGITGVYDNGGKTADRYTVVFDTRDAMGNMYDSLSLSDNADMPNGVSMWGFAIPGKHLGKRITFSELPIKLQQHVQKRVFV